MAVDGAAPRLQENRNRADDPVRMREGTRSWLTASELERERLLDMDVRLKPVRRIAIGLLSVALVVCGPWVGWWTLAPVAIAAIVFWYCDRGIDERRRPEYWLFAGWAFSELTIGICIIITGGPDSPAVAWLAIPAVTLPARFGPRGVAVGLIFTAALMVGVTFGVDPAAIIDEPQKLLFPLALLGGTSILSSALMHSDIEHRAESVLDPLTGLLNRHALNQRFQELSHQAQLTGASVGVIVGDLDHFKRINDEYGHAQGDAVLQDTAYAMRKAMRAFDLIYRLGGEEFIVLLPGANLEDGREVAERLREAVVTARPGGIDVSISLGVSAAVGRRISYEDVFNAADAALYEAKRGGRNRVNVRALLDDAASDEPVAPAEREPVASA
jgi:diguanylate cyclase (GGDEF)-like protein